MKFRRSPTKVQKVMIALMAVAFGALGLWLIPELIGVFSPAVEDTYSEWVFDLPPVWVLAIAGLHGVAGVVLVWSAGHFIEGYSRRRKEEDGAARLWLVLCVAVLVGLFLAIAYGAVAGACDRLIVNAVEEFYCLPSQLFA